MKIEYIEDRYYESILTLETDLQSVKAQAYREGVRPREFRGHLYLRPIHPLTVWCLGFISRKCNSRFLAFSITFFGRGSVYSETELLHGVCCLVVSFWSRRTLAWDRILKWRISSAQHNAKKLRCHAKAPRSRNERWKIRFQKQFFSAESTWQRIVKLEAHQKVQGACYVSYS